MCPTSQLFFRSKGEVKPRPGAVIPKLAEQGLKLNILIPHDPTLLPKSKLSPSRITKHDIKLSQNYPVEIIKLTRGTASPGVFMAKLPSLEAPISYALFSQAAMALARQIGKPVDIVHLFGWEAALFPLYLELAKSHSKLFHETRTFLNISSLRNQGNFSPGLLNYIGVPKELFHPEGIEFFGKVSFLKTGLLFSDGIGLIDEYLGGRSGGLRNGTGLEGVLDAVAFKLRRWASDRSVRTYLEAYRELLMMKKTSSLLPHLLKRLHRSKDQAQSFIESWGPVPPERYETNTISFLQQSPKKAYVFWEWVDSKFSNFGIALEDVDSGSRIIVDQTLTSLGDYWLDVQPGRTYIAELFGVGPNGSRKKLLRSHPLFIPRDGVSANTEAVFVDVKTRKQIKLRTKEDWSKMRTQRGEGTSAWEWTAAKGLPHSLDLVKK